MTICRILLVATLCLLAVPTSASAIPGNEYRRFPDIWRLAYVSGMLDGWVGADVAVSGLGGGNRVVDATFGHIARCITSKRMSRGQTQAIADKYIQDHPSEWHNEMSATVWSAMMEACKE